MAFVGRWYVRGDVRTSGHQYRERKFDIDAVHIRHQIDNRRDEVPASIPPIATKRRGSKRDVEQLAGGRKWRGTSAAGRHNSSPTGRRRFIASNDSPDVPFRYSINPYRGCEHGCSYCYARPTHEQLGMSAGLDFESTNSRQVRRGPSCCGAELGRPGWRGEPIALSA